MINPFQPTFNTPGAPAGVRGGCRAGCRDDYRDVLRSFRPDGCRAQYQRGRRIVLRSVRGVRSGDHFDGGRAAERRIHVHVEE